MDRRQLLRSSMLLGAMLAGGRRIFAESTSGYGPLEPVLDETTGLPLLKLPEGFRYRSFAWEGDPMQDGSPTPGRHDGMALMRWPGADADSFVLMRNHERIFAPPFGRRRIRYDSFDAPPGIAGMGGGTTALVFENGRYSHTVATLAGTIVNCAGGPTPWGSWLTCEELVLERQGRRARNHGYVFEVPAPELGRASTRPIIDMGRMKHEAVAVDSATGFVYLTEDNGPSGLYRFRPRNDSSSLRALEDGGRLEMLRVRGVENADLGLPRAGDELVVEWVPIDDPDARPEVTQGLGVDVPLLVGTGRSGPFLQGQARGGASFRRLEGCFAHDGLIYFTDTTAGAAGTGVLWALAPSPDGEGADGLRCVFASAGEHEADNIDNLCVSPRGGIVLCEDGGGIDGPDGLISGTRVIGLGSNGAAFALVENNMRLDAPIASREWVPPLDYRPSEFAGACFSPNGDRLFVNIQTPGVTFEIRGPWAQGAI